MRWTGLIARKWERRGVYRVLVGKPEVKRPLGIPRRRWKVNIKTGPEAHPASCTMGTGSFPG